MYKILSRDWFVLLATILLMVNCRSDMTLREQVESMRSSTVCIAPDSMFHTFLVDESDSVVLVGNPMQNNQIDNLLKQIVDAHYEGGKNDKSGLVE